MMVAVPTKRRTQFIFGAMLAIAILIRPFSVAAHAELIESNPSPGSALMQMPAQLRLAFSETVASDLSSMSLLSADGSQVLLGPVSTNPDDERSLIAAVQKPASITPGVYTVVWVAYSTEDDHTSAGSFTFSVGTGVAPLQLTRVDAGPSSGAIVGTWLELTSIVLATGLAFFLATTRSSLRQPGDRRIDPFVLLAAIGIIGALVSLRSRAIERTGVSVLGSVDVDTLTALLRTTFGGAWIVRVFALFVILLLALASRVSRAAYTRAAIGLLGIVCIATIAVSGHARSADNRVAAITIDFFHMTAAAVWLGGMLGLLLVVDPPMESERYRSLLASQGNRFAAAVSVLILAGGVTAWWQIDGRGNLTGTAYGKTLLLKIALVVIMLGIAYYSRRVLQGEQPRLSWVPFAIGAEFVFALLVLLLSADLSQLVPANGPLQLQVAARAIELNQNLVGPGTDVELSGILTGAPDDVIFLRVTPDTDLQRLIVKASLIDPVSGEDIGDRFDAQPTAEALGDFQFPAGRLGIAGQWRLELIVRRAGVEDEIIPALIDTSALSVRRTVAVDDRWGGLRPTLHTALALGLAVLMLLLGLAGLRRITGLEPLASGFLLAASILIATGFVVSASRSMLPISPDHSIATPTESDPSTLVRATDLFRLNCAACHGAAGTGVETSAPTHLHGDNADLTRSRTVEQSDGDLRYWIGHGVPGTDMPAFASALSEAEQWQLVLHVRTLQEAAQTANRERGIANAAEISQPRYAKT